MRVPADADGGLERHEDDTYEDFRSRFASCEPLKEMRNVHTVMLKQHLLCVAVEI